MRYAITNDVIKYVVQNKSIWFTIAHGITNMQSKLKYPITKDFIRYTISNVVIKYAITKKSIWIAITKNITIMQSPTMLSNMEPQIIQ